MARKKRCALGSSCPYQHESQHVQEYSHDEDRPTTGRVGGRGRGRSGEQQRQRGRRLGGRVKRQRPKPEAISVEDEEEEGPVVIDVVSDSDDDVVLEKVVSAERALREEQDSEFERSLRLDALKASKRAREEEEKRAAEDAKRRRRERVEKQPKGGGIRIKFRMPEGSSLIGEFCGTATLDDLRDYLLVVAETSAPIHIDFVDAVARTRLVRPPLADSTLLVVDRDA